MPVVLEGLAGPVELLTYREAAELLDVVTPTIHTYVHRGLLHPIRLAAGAGLDRPHKSDLPFLLAEELAWYATRRRLGAQAAGPSPYVERYMELLAAGAAVMPLLSGADAQLDTLAPLNTAEILAQIRGNTTQALQAAPSTPDALDAGAELIPEGAGSLGLAGLGGLAALLILIVLALILNRQPDAGRVEQLRAVPGAGRLPRALREAADLLDKAA